MFTLYWIVMCDNSVVVETPISLDVAQGVVRALQEHAINNQRHEVYWIRPNL